MSSLYVKFEGRCLSLRPRLVADLRSARWLVRLRCSPAPADLDPPFLQHVMADTLGSVGVIISTLLINRYGWTGFDPLASIFIAVLIFASVVPLVVDSGRLLILDMGEEREVEVRKALLGVSFGPHAIGSPPPIQLSPAGLSR